MIPFNESAFLGSVLMVVFAISRGILPLAAAFALLAVRFAIMAAVGYLRKGKDLP